MNHYQCSGVEIIEIKMKIVCTFKALSKSLYLGANIILNTDLLDTVAEFYLWTPAPRILEYFKNLDSHSNNEIFLLNNSKFQISSCISKYLIMAQIHLIDSQKYVEHATHSGRNPRNNWFWAIGCFRCYYKFQLEHI